MNPNRALRVNLGHLTSQQAREHLREFAQVIQHEVRRWKLRIRRRPWIDPDDLDAIGQVAALEAVTRYNADASNTMSLRGFVRRTVRQRLHDSIDSDYDTGDKIRVIEVRPDGTTREYWAAWVMVHTVSLDQVVAGDDASRHTLTLIDTLVSEDYDPDALVAMISNRRVLEKILSRARLTSRHVQVLSAMLRGQSEKSLGMELGISKQKVNVDKQEMLAILRRYGEQLGFVQPPAAEPEVLTTP